MRSDRRLILTVVGVALLRATLTAGIGDRVRPGGPGEGRLIDVPYLAQTPALCGGAAVAMVLRYWGDDDVLPQDFKDLVDPQARGIATDVLRNAVTRAGWVALTGDLGEDRGLVAAATQIALGRPVIALLDAGTQGSYHYVVIVGLTADDVVFHDPGRAAFRVLSRADFDHVWAATGRWSMVILPNANRAPGLSVSSVAQTAATGPQPAVPATCAVLVDAGVERALDGDAVTAEGQLRAAAALCPSVSAPWRELAGLRFQESRWSEARDLAAKAVDRNEGDEDARQLLAASRFMLGDDLGALEAWNSLQEPRTDTVNVHGNTQTHAPAVVRLLDIQPRQVLSAGAFSRAERRLADLPAATSARLRYEPIRSGRVTLHASIAERDRIPHGWLALGEVGGRALLTNELTANFTNALHAGEEWTTNWRWSSVRPLLAGALAIPAPMPLQGILSMDVAWERQTYSAHSPGQLLVQSRRQVGLHLADWTTGALHWNLGAALDRLDMHDHLRLDAGLDRRLLRDRVSLRGAASWWSPSAGYLPAVWSVDAAASWRSTTERSGPMLRADAGWLFVSDAAPLALWPGAGTGQGRPALLRAHPLLAADVVAGPAFGRTLTHATLGTRAR